MIAQMRVLVVLLGFVLAPSVAQAQATVRNDSFRFEIRFGPSLGYAQLDAGNTLDRRLGVGGYLGVDLIAPLAALSESMSVIGELTWLIADIRAVDPGGSIAGASEYGVAVGIRQLLDRSGYFTASIGYFGAADGQATYPDPADGLPIFHAISLRGRLRMGPVAFELAGGGLPPISAEFRVGGSVQIAGPVWLGVDFHILYAAGESPYRMGRELYLTRGVLAIRLGDE